METEATEKLSQSLLAPDVLDDALSARVLLLSLPWNEELNAWVHVVPDAMKVTPLMGDEGKSWVMLGIEGTASMGIGLPPDVSRVAVPTPTVGSLEPGFDLAIPVTVPVSLIANELRNELAIRLNDKGKRPVDVMSAWFYPAKGGLGVSVELAGDFGPVWGRPAVTLHSLVTFDFDKESSSIRVATQLPRVDDLEWPLSSIAAKALGDDAGKPMEFSISLTSTMEQLNFRLSEMLSSLGGENLMVAARVEHMNVERVTVDGDALLIVARVQGQATINALPIRSEMAAVSGN